MLIGGAVREAAVLGYHVTPLFSYYAYHGPVFRGWVGNGAGVELEKLLKHMLDESDPRLPPGYIKLDEVRSILPSLLSSFSVFGDLPSHQVTRIPPFSDDKTSKNEWPSIEDVDAHLAGASRSHIASSAIKTDCGMAVLTKLAKELVSVPQS
ncbi:unnamed protein product [Linum tenue]|uniref:Uncharacterized protein n=1 Tax=Linum tenue TaxID=586396 RepID=A0AAV0LA37_9ROSI|nr:unnamed protein product [Linum tenue]